jgi:hypothetical protein
MISNFELLYENLINFFLIEGLQYSKLKELNTQVSLIEKKFKKISERKNQLKELSKVLILHITNNNYQNILNDEKLSDLKQFAGRMTDENFKNHLSDKLSTLTPMDYNNFWENIGNKIITISKKNNNEFENLRKLRPQYLMGF